MSFYYISSMVVSGLLVLIVSADFDYTPLFLIPIRNLYHDFEETWYEGVGTVIITS